MSHHGLLTRCAVGVVLSLCVWPPPSIHAQDLPAPGLIDEPGMIERAVVFADRRQGNGELTNGFYPDVFNMIPGAGWISAGPGYRRWYSRDSAVVDASTAISWRGYKTLQARFELPRLASSRVAVGSQFRWHDFTQVSFFGTGPASLETNRSEYRLRSRNLAGYVTLKPTEFVSVGAQLGWLRPSVLPRAGWFEGDTPDTRRLFSTDPVFAVGNDSTFVQREVSVTADTRDFPRHATHGGLYRAALATFTDSGDVFSFTRYEAEAAQFIPFGDSGHVIALRGWLVASDTGAGHVVPFYFQPSLGGDNTLRSYPDYRFHDRNMLVINAEGRIAVTTHLEAAVFLDLGSVAARIADLNVDRRSYGAGVRLHTRRQTFARIDLARGDEGWRLVLRLTDPLDLSRLSRRALFAPFVP